VFLNRLNQPFKAGGVKRQLSVFLSDNYSSSSLTPNQ